MDYAKFKTCHMIRTIRDNSVFHNVIFDLTDIVFDGAIKVKDGNAYRCFLKPKNGKYLPLRISVVGTTSAYAFKYDRCTGEIYIPSGEIYADITIAAIASDIATNNPIRLQVHKTTATTYDGTNTYENEKFIHMDLMLDRGGTVTVEYGGLIKRLETMPTPGNNYNGNVSQSIFFGTYNGIADDIDTPDNGIMTIYGPIDALFLYGSVTTPPVEDGGKSQDMTPNNVDAIIDSGSITYAIPMGFYECTNIVTVNFSETLQNIYITGITDMGITTLAIPASVTEIQGDAITRLPNLTEVTFLGKNPPDTLGEDFIDLDLCPLLERIVVPADRAEIYKARTEFAPYINLIVEAQ